MNDTGPEAVPPPLTCSEEDRSGDKLVPVPDPHLNSIPSVWTSRRMLSMLSSTELMKQAEHCGCRYASVSCSTTLRSVLQNQPFPFALRPYFCHKPQLNHTGELNDAACRTSK